MTNNDFGLLAICGVRYALGRHTYMPSEVQRIIKDNFSLLSQNDHNVLIRDISQYLEEANEEDKSGRFKYEYDGWCNFLDQLKEYENDNN